MGKINFAAKSASLKLHHRHRKRLRNMNFLNLLQVEPETLVIQASVPFCLLPCRSQRSKSLATKTNLLILHTF